ncbi:zinc-ribbon domain-containing protein [Bradyrhizobium erythrophlei]|uniref:zinc-ribbon domain-containing protein n=1 Tax=Bradyrhizobium erythrophlei TaxID=1437360 RepID=UPI0018D307C5|nr:zinc-ribbon domain-containing protein [Bradyrhizobium erythrophlei]
MTNIATDLTKRPNALSDLQRPVAKLEWEKSGLGMEVIDCHDCKRPVSFSAVACPHCGSLEAAGPYRFSKKEARRYRIEQKNDNNLLITSLAFGAIGAAYGVFANIQGIWTASVAALAYGLLGILIGVPVAFTVNMVRNLRYFFVPVVLTLALLAYHIFH